ncbi:Beta-galactosidase [Cucumis melo var. makuwa]|uniref:Beta-galactosidase n=1 Tax=Cucumis melo var. makuwa TaxID=1194695 RepID=A0A5D3E551_CUCMM|nr:Beta-galactosidase [Cucumis melo var. makuwa]TYK30918.1 Beta-galactosidase [Cucumis melo var. makuwa]
MVSERSNNETLEKILRITRIKTAVVAAVDTTVEKLFHRIHASPLLGAWAHALPFVNLTAHPIRSYASSPVQPSHPSSHPPPIAAGQQPSKLSNLYSSANLYSNTNLRTVFEVSTSLTQTDLPMYSKNSVISLPNVPSNYITNSVAFSVQSLTHDNEKPILVCEHCKKQWHTKDRCWKLHGRPPRGNKRSSKEQQNLGRTDVREIASTSQPIGPIASQTSSSTLSAIAQSADGSLAPIAGKGQIVLFDGCSLQNVLHDLNSGRTIGTARHSRGLYILNDDTSDVSSLSSDVCIRAKQHRVSFPSQPYKPTQPFTLIHNDVWGPSKVTTSSGKRWFLTFIDDHTRLTWVYLITDKSEVFAIFQNFYHTIETQFHKKIVILRSDNGREFQNHNLSEFLVSKGIVHQNSCAYPPRQNGVAERKNHHLLEVAHSLMLSTSLLSYL